jgi:hypothetical protein
MEPVKRVTDGLKELLSRRDDAHDDTTDITSVKLISGPGWGFDNPGITPPLCFCIKQQISTADELNKVGLALLAPTIKIQKCVLETLLPMFHDFAIYANQAFADEALVMIARAVFFRTMQLMEKSTSLSEDDVTIKLPHYKSSLEALRGNSYHLYSYLTIFRSQNELGKFLYGAIARNFELGHVDDLPKDSVLECLTRLYGDDETRKQELLSVFDGYPGEFPWTHVWKEDLVRLIFHREVTEAELRWVDLRGFLILSYDIFHNISKKLPSIFCSTHTIENSDLVTLYETAWKVVTFNNRVNAFSCASVAKELVITSALKLLLSLRSNTSTSTNDLLTMICQTKRGRWQAEDHKWLDRYIRWALIGEIPPHMLCRNPSDSSFFDFLSGDDWEFDLPSRLVSESDAAEEESHGEAGVEPRQEVPTELDPEQELPVKVTSEHPAEAEGESHGEARVEPQDETTQESQGEAHGEAENLNDAIASPIIPPPSPPAQSGPKEISAENLLYAQLVSEEEKREDTQGCCCHVA